LVKNFFSRHKATSVQSEKSRAVRLRVLGLTCFPMFSTTVAQLTLS